MKNLLACLLLVSLVGCASVPSIPRQIPETMKAACDLYVRARPDVIAAREYAKAHWDQVPEDVKPILLRLDSYLPELDRAGLLICAADQGLGAFTPQGAKVDWDQVLTTVLRTASFAVELKGKGLI